MDHERVAVMIQDFWKPTSWNLKKVPSPSISSEKMTQISSSNPTTTSTITSFKIMNRDLAFKRHVYLRVSALSKGRWTNAESTCQTAPWRAWRSFKRCWRWWRAIVAWKNRATGGEFDGVRWTSCHQWKKKRASGVNRSGQKFMGNWGYKPTCRGYNSTDITGSGAHLVGMIRYFFFWVRCPSNP